VTQEAFSFVTPSVHLVSFVSSIIVLVVGFFVAGLLKKLVINILDAVRLNDFAVAIKLKPLLDRGEIKQSPSYLIGGAVYWLAVYFLIFFTASYSGINIEPAVQKIFNSFGVVLLAAFVLGFGSFLGLICGNFVYFISVNVGLPGAKTIGKLTQYAAVVTAFLLAIEQLGIGPALLVPSIGVIIGALGLAVAIAFGLGCKDIMADFISNLIKGK